MLWVLKGITSLLQATVAMVWPCTLHFYSYHCSVGVFAPASPFSSWLSGPCPLPPVHTQTHTYTPCRVIPTQQSAQ